MPARRSGGVEKLPGGMNNYAATIPAGKVGVWAGSGSATVKADDRESRRP